MHLAGSSRTCFCAPTGSFSCSAHGAEFNGARIGPGGPSRFQIGSSIFPREAFQEQPPPNEFRLHFADATSAEAEVATEFFRRFEWLIEKLMRNPFPNLLFCFKTSSTLDDASREDFFEENVRSYIPIR
jgi:hypothetical protein